ALDQREHLEHYATSSLRDSSARRTFSGVMGRSVIWTPIASVTALAIAGIGGLAVISPTPFMPYGPFDDATSRTTASTSGRSKGPGMRYVLKSPGAWSIDG